MVSFADQIKEAGKRIGLDKIGIVRVDVLDPERDRLKDWLDRGFHGEMRWMEREPEKRSDPRLIFPEARSVVVAALNYYTPHKHVPDAEKGKISRYAWGDDYHDVLKEKLRYLLAWICSERPEAEGRICVDTAPVMDKAWAARAGLGWIGKHSNLITRELGSWVFIGEILLNIDLDAADEIVADHCGSCTACLDACPTNAIVEPYVVDAQKCISYATIELRDDTLPDTVSDHLNGWIYGCDICQDVCPWNRFEKPADEMRFEPRKLETSLSLDLIDTMTHEEYVERFRKSAIKRAKLAGLKRNSKALRGG